MVGIGEEGGRRDVGAEMDELGEVREKEELRE